MIYVINSKEARSKAAKAVSELRGTPTMQVEIKEYVEDKTAAQRKYWHKLLEIFGEHVGLTKDQMKTEIKKQVLGSQMIQFNGHWTEVVPSSEDEKKKGYSVLIDETIRIAAEMGFMLEDPLSEFRKDFPNSEVENANS